MKAYIITMSNRSDSLDMVRVLKESIIKTQSQVEPEHFEALQPPQLYKRS